MIHYLRGNLVDKQPTRVVVDVAGVGYEVFIPLSSYDRLPALNAECKLLTYDCVREDSHQLYGFVAPEERDMFLLLLDVTGIGPRMALTALSGMTVRELRAAIGNADAKRLSSISGIGRKTAERMIVELKDKLPRGEVLEASTSRAPLTEEDARLRDAILALVALGYKEAQAREMTAAVVTRAEGRKLSVEDIIKQALAR